MRLFASIAAAACSVTLLPMTAFAQATTPAPTATAQPGTAGQAAAAPVVGATVYDAQGMEVGKVESVAGGSAIVFTGTNRAAVPLASFGASPKGPTLGMTRAELDQAAAKAASAATDQLRARLTPGTDVRGKAGAVIAQVKACLLYTSPSPRDRQKSRMPSSA